MNGRQKRWLLGSFALACAVGATLPLLLNILNDQTAGAEVSLSHIEVPRAEPDHDATGGVLLVRRSPIQGEPPVLKVPLARGPTGYSDLERILSGTAKAEPSQALAEAECVLLVADHDDALLWHAGFARKLNDTAELYVLVDSGQGELGAARMAFERNPASYFEGYCARTRLCHPPPNLRLEFSAEGVTLSSRGTTIAPGCHGAGPGTTIPRSQTADHDWGALEQCLRRIRTENEVLGSMPFVVVAERWMTVADYLRYRELARETDFKEPVRVVVRSADVAG